MRDTLKKYFISAAMHHTQMAKLAKASMDSSDEDSDEHTMHKAMMDSHINHAQTCTECAKACDTMSRKVEGHGEIQPLPAGFSKLAPTPPGVTMVPRAGQKMPTRPQIDQDFADLVKIEDGQQE